MLVSGELSRCQQVLQVTYQFDSILLLIQAPAMAQNSFLYKQSGGGVGEGGGNFSLYFEPGVKCGKELRVNRRTS